MKLLIQIFINQLKLGLVDYILTAFMSTVAEWRRTKATGGFDLYKTMFNQKTQENARTHE